MAQTVISLRQYAMKFGTILGLFFIFKFIFFPLSLTSTFAGMLFITLTLMVPILGYQFVKRFRDSVYQGNMPLLQAFAFTILVFAFASLLVSVAHFTYFRFMDNGQIFQSYMDSINQLKALNLDGIEGMKEQLDIFKQTVTTLGSLSAIEITVKLLVNNLFWTVLLAFPIALLVSRKKVNR